MNQVWLSWKCVWCSDQWDSSLTSEQRHLYCYNIFYFVVKNIHQHYLSIIPSFTIQILNTSKTSNHTLIHIYHHTICYMYIWSKYISLVHAVLIRILQHLILYCLLIMFNFVSLQMYIEFTKNWSLVFLYVCYFSFH